VGYKALTVGDKNIALNNFHLNHVGYKAIKPDSRLHTIDGFHLNHVGYKALKELRPEECSKLSSEPCGI